MATTPPLDLFAKNVRCHRVTVDQVQVGGDLPLHLAFGADPPLDVLLTRWVNEAAMDVPSAAGSTVWVVIKIIRA